MRKRTLGSTALLALLFTAGTGCSVSDVNVQMVPGADAAAGQSGNAGGAAGTGGAAGSGGAVGTGATAGAGGSDTDAMAGVGGVEGTAGSEGAGGLAPAEAGVDSGDADGAGGLLDTGGSGGAGDSGGTDGSAGIDSGETGGSAEIDSGIDSGGSGAGGTGGFDAGCASETDAAFCARLFKNCGSVTANDTCGASRTVSWCGTCSPPQTCGGSNICGEYVPSSPSCSGGLTCSGESCCTSIVVPGGTFLQGRSTVENASDFSPGGASDEVPEFSSTVSSFALDKYEVTVGRFREFVDAYVSNTTSAPADGAGANPAVPGSGWQSAWGASLPATQAAFKSPSHLSCSTSNQTWTNNVGANEDKAINCVDWFEAFAFCIWDGGRLPTEAEWEYTAAGGADNRLYPWGLAAPDCRYANYKNGAYLCSGSVVDVGSAPIGNGRWGHADLGGNVWEWTLDWYATYPASARTDYANIVTGFSRVVRGGVFDTVALNLRSACRGTVSGRDVGRVGVRCARSAP